MRALIALDAVVVLPLVYEWSSSLQYRLSHTHRFDYSRDQY